MGEKGLKLDLTSGTEYKNRNENSYKCVSLLEDKRGSAVMRRVSDGYVLTAHGVREHEDGLIEWDYQSNGHWGKYWSRDGRFEEDLERMESQMPDIGFTGNGYTDALIIACKLYYDAYNNGGCNIDEHYLTEAKRILTPLMPSFNISAFINCVEDKMEKEMDSIILLLRDKDLSFKNHYVIWNDDLQEIKIATMEESVEKRPEGWCLVTFGDVRKRDEWIADRESLWEMLRHDT